ncbi:MAG: transketolase C-terminal domain-containing protein [Bacillota bacterium]
MAELYFVPYREFQRVNNMNTSPEQGTALFAALCRINTLYMITRAGSGHIGSSFSCMDMVTWLFKNELRLTQYDQSGPDVYFSSKGHDVPALYSVLIGMGLLEFEMIHKLRRLGGLPGHPDVSTPFIVTNTGSLGMGISKAKGMALANRLQKRIQKIYVLTGDGELQEGQIWESLLSAANLKLSEITAIVDHNKIQSDTWVSKTSALGNLEEKFTAFGWHVERCDGHNIGEFSAALSRCKSVRDKPKVIIADTIKGKGVSFMEHTSMGSEGHEDTLYRFHSGAPDREAYSQGASELIAAANEQLRKLGAAELKVETVPWPARLVLQNPQRLIACYARELVKHAEANPRIVALDADLAVDCGVLPFKNRFPERFFECGIAEQDMVSQAGGMALKGLLPVVHSFACFLSARPNEHIYNNASEKTKIIYVGSLAGVLPGMPGHSHQAVRDIAALSAIPGLVMIEPCNEAELVMAFDYLVNSASESSYLRLVSIPCEVPYELPPGYLLEYGKGAMLTEGRDAVLFAYGPVMLSQACNAAGTLLDKYGIGLRVVDLPWLNRVDSEWLKKMVSGYKWVFTIDNHYITGGQGEMIAGRLAALDMLHPLKIRNFGVRGIPACGANDEVLKAHRLDSDSLCEEILATMERSRP